MLAPKPLLLEPRLLLRLLRVVLVFPVLFEKGLDLLESLKPDPLCDVALPVD